MRRVLIVDDQASIRAGLRSLLDAFPEWEVCGEADNGNRGVELAHQLKPDVVLMDFSMPGMDGLEATQNIKTDLPKIKVLLLTVHESKELARIAFQAGVNGYVAKADTQRGLLRALNAVMRDEIYVSPEIDAEKQVDSRRARGQTGSK